MIKLLDNDEEILNKKRKQLQFNFDHYTNMSFSAKYSSNVFKKILLKEKQTIYHEITVLQKVMAFVASSIVAFSGLYISDSIAAQQNYIITVLKISQSQLGLLSSSIYFPSLFMPIICAPIIDKIGPELSGLIMNIFNAIITIPMAIYCQEYQQLFILRVLSGIFQEAAFSVQSCLILNYFDKHISFWFGLSTSISALSSLVCFFAIPQVMKNLNIDSNQQKYIGNYKATFWLNFYVSFTCLIVYLISILFIIKINKKQKHDQKQKTEDDDFQESFLEEDYQSDMDYLKDLHTINIIPNKMSFPYKFKKYFSLSIDFWLINFAYCQLLCISYSAQTLLLFYITQHGGVILANSTGITFSIAGIIGGPICGILVFFIKRRPLLQILCFNLGIISFLLLFMSPGLSPHISMFLIGFLDGSAQVIGRSLIQNVVYRQQINAAYSISAVMLSIGQFVYPPLCGMIQFDWPTKSSGIIWFWVFLLFSGLFVSILIILRDFKYYNKKLSK